MFERKDQVTAKKKSQWFCVQVRLWQDVKTISFEERASRFAWSKYLFQELVFRDEDSPNSQELTKFSPLVEFLNVMEYYQARKMVFDYSSKYQEESWKYDAQRSISYELWGVWKCG